MIFRRTARDTDGVLLQIECYHEPRGPREPEHIHPLQESRFEILAGRLRFHIAGSERAAGPGEVVTIPQNAPHSFWNDGEEVAHYMQEFRPALGSEGFFRTLFGLARAGKINTRGMPSPLALAVLVPAMGDAIRPTSPPWPLLRGLAWVLGPVAGLRGYRKLLRDVDESPSHPQHSDVRQTMRECLAATQADFHDLLDRLTDTDLRRQSDNPAWTVGAVLTHLTWSLEQLPREVASARKGKGMYNMPRPLRDWLSAMAARLTARGQTLDSLRHRYDIAIDAALETLEGVGDNEFGLGARFWSEGFRDIAGLYAAQVDHLAEHGDDIRRAVPNLATIASSTT
jgi:hypothetical protein